MNGTIIGFGSKGDPESLALETRDRHHINNVPLKILPSDLRKERVRVITDAFPSIIPISEPLAYNCYGMVFAARRTAIVEDQDVRTILKDDEYHRLPWDPAAWRVGDIVIYRKPSDDEIVHVGMIAGIETDLEGDEARVTVLSAWGQDGEYLHPMETISPLLGAPTEVVSQRTLSK